MDELPSASVTLPRETSVGAEPLPPPPVSSAAHNLPSIRLVALTLDDARALLAGTGRPRAGLPWHDDYPTDDTVGTLDMLIGAHRAMGWSGERVPAWWLHQIVLDEVVVGDIAFHGPPAVGEAAEVEIGYCVVAPVRGRGVATRACRLILERAWHDGATVVLAETDSGNRASQQVLLRSGFRESGHRYVIERPAREQVGP